MLRVAAAIGLGHQIECDRERLRRIEIVVKRVVKALAIFEGERRVRRYRHRVAGNVARELAEIVEVRLRGAQPIVAESAISERYFAPMQKTRNASGSMPIAETSDKSGNLPALFEIFAPSFPVRNAL